MAHRLEYVVHEAVATVEVQVPSVACVVLRTAPVAADAATADARTIVVIQVACSMEFQAGCVEAVPGGPSADGIHVAPFGTGGQAPSVAKFEHAGVVGR